FTGLCLLTPIVYVMASKLQGPPKSQVTLQDLTNQLLDQTSQYSQAKSSAEKLQNLQAIQATASQRKSIMLDLIKNNPSEAIALALPANIRDQLPPDVQSQVEQVGSQTDYLDLVHSDDFTHKISTFLPSLSDGKGHKIALHFTKLGNEDNLFKAAGTKVTAQGVQLGGQMATTGVVSATLIACGGCGGGPVPSPQNTKPKISPSSLAVGYTATVIRASWTGNGSAIGSYQDVWYRCKNT